TMEAMLESALEKGLISDAVVAASTQQQLDLWRLRENISEAQSAEGQAIKHDIAVPISGVAEAVEDISKSVAAHFPDVRPMVFGHLGDGNLHYNISPPAGRTGAEFAAEFLALERPLNTMVHDIVVRHGGSISAEHGLGVLRRDEVARYKSPTELRLMRTFKRALDPAGIMNPGKVLV